MVNICSKFIQFLLPDHCLLCRLPLPPRPLINAGLCAGCIRDLPWLGPACHGCGLPLPGGHGALCGQCQQHPPPFARVHSCWRYARPLDSLILRMKFAPDPAVATSLGKLLAISIEASGLPLPDLLLPVPLHSHRLRQRGFNQALEIARPVARRLALTLDGHSGQRLRDTRPQSELSSPERRANLRGAFSLRRRFDDLHVAIIDDVMTSGHTVAELARQLRRQGAAQVSVWCCARTVT